jgi:putative nucleotidyltransferase with HDIG domain
MFRRFLTGSLVYFTCLATFLLLFMPERPPLDLKTPLAGEVLNTNLVAPFDFDVLYTDEEMAELEEETRALIAAYLRMDYGVWEEVKAELAPLLADMGLDSAYIRGVSGELEGQYERGVFSLDDVRESYSGDRMVLLTDSGATDHDLFDLNEMEDVRGTLEGLLSRHLLSPDDIQSALYVLRPNAVTDDSARNANADAAVAALGRVDTTIAEGSIIILAGQPATDRTMELVTNLQRSSPGLRDFRQPLGILLVTALLLTISLLYVREIMPDTWRSMNQILLLSVIWMLSLAVTGILWTALRGNYGFPYATMVTFGAAMTSIFFSRRDAFFFTFFFSLAVGLVHPHPYSMVLISSVTGSLAASTVWNVRRRNSVPEATWMAAAGGVCMYLLLRLLQTTGESSSVLPSVIELIISPVIGIGASSALLVTFEKLFRVYTVLAIDEVNRTDHKLLKEMREKAPGTWSHSLSVAELAGQAAGAINAWEALASAGGYFHDVGKLKRPEMFIENQTTDLNPHDSMDPRESARLIIAHIGDGVEMATREKLPRAVVDIIRQHHGTTLAQYFYSKARRDSEHPESVREEDFRYRGPRPTTIEAAIVMLADQVASATKNLLSPGEIRSVVEKTVEGRDLEGELDDCHLTRRNLKTIAEVFTTILESRFHRRVEDYPTPGGPDES